MFYLISAEDNGECKDGQVPCFDGTCIREDWVCDGVNDCRPINSDELGCEGTQLGWLISSWTNGRHFADDIVRCIFVNEKFCILIKISLMVVPEGPIDNNAALV